MLNKGWMKEIFAGRKKLFKRIKVDFIDVPKYDEISVKALYDKLITFEGMSFYFPVKYPKGRQADRDYFFNIANTLHPDVVNEVLKHALNQRYSISGEKQQQEAIIISDEWAEELKAMPFFSNVSTVVRP